MASLQSSLNTAIPFGNALSEIVGRINNVVFRNTAPDQFITFFAAIYDPETSVLTYVNAGHDVPILARVDGSLEFLEIGGVILGCLQDLKYQEGRVKLNSGDSLMLYTDGVREAWNAEEEEFGVERLESFAVKSRLLSPNEQIQHLQKEIIEFHGSNHFDDDFTLLIVKVL